MKRLSSLGTLNCSLPVFFLGFVAYHVLSICIFFAAIRGFELYMVIFVGWPIVIGVSIILLVQMIVQMGRKRSRVSLPVSNALVLLIVEFLIAIAGLMQGPHIASQQLFYTYGGIYFLFMLFQILVVIIPISIVASAKAVKPN